MKHMKKISDFLRIIESKENVTIHKAEIIKMCELSLPDPDHGDLKLSVMPFENNGEWVSLPEGFKIWEKSFNDILNMIPQQEGANTHYVTIDSKFFTTPEFLRREGIHVDGNFCVDPNFVSLNEFKSSWGGATPKPTWGGSNINIDDDDIDDDIDGEIDSGFWGNPDMEIKSSWGGATPKPTWGGAKIHEYKVMEDNSHVKMDWVLPYNLVIPIGDYISNKKGGILTVSTEVGCQGWRGQFEGEVLSEGAYDNMIDQLTDDKKVVFEKNSLYFMTSNTPHETLLIDKGLRRTFMRITLNHNYLNEKILR